MFPRSELPIIDDDPVVFDEPAEWLVPGLRTAMHEAEDDGLGLRSLIERAEVPPRPRPVARYRRASGRAASPRARRAPVPGTV
jgi:hypothetical protein